MEYLKTYNESLEDFYLQNNSVYLIVDESENWVLDNIWEGGCSDGCESEIYILNNNKSEFVDNHNVTFIHSIKYLSNFFSNVIHESEEEAKQWLDTVYSDRMEIPYYDEDNKIHKRVNPIFISPKNKDDDYSNLKIEKRLRENFLSGNPVLDMKFKIVEFQMGFQKNKILDI